MIPHWIAGITAGVSVLASAQQQSFSVPQDVPRAPLEWGHVNIIATTDTHGWLLGHSGQPSFGGTFGDLYSFQAALREKARAEGRDVLLVDCGDRVDGNGLVDADPSDVKGTTAMHLFKQMPYDLITVGNHELYKYDTARMNYDVLREAYGERFIVSNVDIDVDGAMVPLGSRYRLFTTEQGRSVLALGVLFDFHSNAQGTYVTPPCAMVKQEWFSDALHFAADVDVIVLAGHMPVRGPTSDFACLVKAIRATHPKTPILGVGGHHHIRDCAQPDDHAIVMAPGRYMETVGWLTANLSSPPSFTRRYLDQNRLTYAYHTGPSFDTAKGLALTAALAAAAETFNLTYTFGYANDSFYTSRYPPDSERSILNLFTQHVSPALLAPYKEDRDFIFILNTGSIRYDVFKGPFTVNDQWASMPFGNKLEVVRNVGRRTARMLLPYLNLVGEHQLVGDALQSDEPPTLRQDAMTGSHDQDLRAAASAASDDAHVARIFEDALDRSAALGEKDDDLSQGYVTLDACPGIPDDTPHTPFPSAKQPTFVSTQLDSSGPNVDVVYLDFIRIDILRALNRLQLGHTFTDDDVELFTGDIVANQLLSSFAVDYWN